MKSTILRNLALFVLVSVIIVRHSVQVVADGVNSVTDDRSGPIRIDCGATQESWDENNFYYEADGAKFVKFGEIHNVSSQYSLTSNDSQIWRQLNTLRSIAEGKRNCYTLTPKLGKEDYKYLIKASFQYGNYDNLYSSPFFDLHLGFNNFASINLDDSRGSYKMEIIHVSRMDNVEVYLANTGLGLPLISLLELYSLPKTLYQCTIDLIWLDIRGDLGTRGPSDFLMISSYSYQDDPYGRSWTNKTVDNSMSIHTSEAIDDYSNEYKLPKQVLNSAITSLNSSSSLVINVDATTNDEYHVYLHFFDFQEHHQNQQRSMEITFTDTIRESVTLSYKKLHTIEKTIPIGSIFNEISISSSSTSGLPSMINAYEIYRVIGQSNSPTHEGDADAMRKIKESYNVMRISWQGDPCRPENYRWEGVTCNYSESSPRIISLNMSSSKLQGEMVAYFSNLMMLGSLDLSNNQLTGEIPQFLAKLPKLKALNLTGNNLKGSIPKALREKLSTGLTLRYFCPQRSYMVPDAYMRYVDRSMSNRLL